MIRERPEIWSLTLATSVASCANRRMVRSRFETSARNAADIDSECVSS